jgi:hypothetical protein
MLVTLRGINLILRLIFYKIREENQGIIFPFIVAQDERYDGHVAQLLR